MSAPLIDDELQAMLVADSSAVVKLVNAGAAMSSSSGIRKRPATIGNNNYLQQRKYLESAKQMKLESMMTGFDGDDEDDDDDSLFYRNETKMTSSSVYIRQHHIKSEEL
jgi:hypothetical protein